MRDWLYRIYMVLERALAPGLRYSQYEYRDHLLGVLRGDDWLDIGCGHQVYGECTEQDQQRPYQQCGRAVGVDLDFEGLRKHAYLRQKAMASGYALPFADGTFDLVTANMVLEHVDQPAVFLAEVYRVLRPGGRCLFHTPNARGYRTALTRLVMNQSLKNTLIWWLEGRAEEDVFPAFYRLNRHEDIERHSRQAGFARTEIRAHETSAMFQSLPPLVVFELLLIRAIRRFATRYQAVLLMTLHKEALAPASTTPTPVAPGWVKHG